eukprot:TRINITY_DN12593_c0_g1_i3.p1 TRINITY_DN12593_c0_g1~~TRINITY_DN12593_c0_g1_i3.p1  ORF type:complete len:2851 (+),score=868.86 TRINITY_DN12593_c0_g1_i3:102-8654(+)
MAAAKAAADTPTPPPQSDPDDFGLLRVQVCAGENLRCVGFDLLPSFIGKIFKSSPTESNVCVDFRVEGKGEQSGRSRVAAQPELSGTQPAKSSKTAQPKWDHAEEFSMLQPVEGCRLKLFLWHVPSGFLSRVPLGEAELNLEPLAGRRQRDGMKEWVAVSGAGAGDAGKVQVDVKWLPSPKVQARASGTLPELPDDPLPGQEPRRKKDAAGRYGAGEWHIRVRVLQARGLQTSSGDPSPMVTVCYGAEKEATQSSRGADPYFDTTFSFVQSSPYKSFWSKAVTVDVYDDTSLFGFGVGSSKDRVGGFAFEMGAVYRQPDHEYHRRWVALTRGHNDFKVRGYLQVTVQVIGPDDEYPDHPEVEPDADAFDMKTVLQPKRTAVQVVELTAAVWRAEGLPQMDMAFTTGISLLDRLTGAADTSVQRTDPYLKLVLGSDAVSSAVRTSTYSPEWNQRLRLSVNVPWLSSELKVQLMDQDAIRDEVISTHVMHLNSMCPLERSRAGGAHRLPYLKTRWINLYGAPRSTHGMPSLRQHASAKSMNSEGELGCAYRGRVLMGLTSANARESGKEVIPALSQSDAPLFSVREYDLRVQLLCGYALPNEEVTVEVSVGEYYCRSRAVQAEWAGDRDWAWRRAQAFNGQLKPYVGNHHAAWEQELCIRSRWEVVRGTPRGTRDRLGRKWGLGMFDDLQMPDVILTLRAEGGEAVGFARLDPTELLALTAVEEVTVECARQVDPEYDLTTAGEPLRRGARVCVIQKTGHFDESDPSPYLGRCGRVTSVIPSAPGHPVLYSLTFDEDELPDEDFSASEICRDLELVLMKEHVGLPVGTQGRLRGPPLSGEPQGNVAAGELSPTHQSPARERPRAVVVAEFQGKLYKVPESSQVSVLGRFHLSLPPQTPDGQPQPGYLRFGESGSATAAAAERLEVSRVVYLGDVELPTEGDVPERRRHCLLLFDREDRCIRRFTIIYSSFRAVYPSLYRLCQRAGVSLEGIAGELPLVDTHMMMSIDTRDRANAQTRFKGVICARVDLTPVRTSGGWFCTASQRPFREVNGVRGRFAGPDKPDADGKCGWQEEREKWGTSGKKDGFPNFVDTSEMGSLTEVVGGALQGKPQQSKEAPKSGLWARRESMPLELRKMVPFVFRGFVHTVRGLSGTDSDGSADVYLRVYFADGVGQTRTKLQALSPVFEETVEFAVSLPDPHVYGTPPVIIEVWDEDIVESDTLMGRGVFTVLDMNQMQLPTPLKWRPLLHVDASPTENDRSWNAKTCGEVLCSFQLATGGKVCSARSGTILAPAPEAATASKVASLVHVAKVTQGTGVFEEWVVETADGKSERVQASSDWIEQDCFAVHVRHAVGLSTDMDLFGGADPYVRVKVHGARSRTRTSFDGDSLPDVPMSNWLGGWELCHMRETSVKTVKKGAEGPVVWHETFLFSVDAGDPSATVFFEVYDRDTGPMDDDCYGGAKLLLADALTAERTVKTFELEVQPLADADALTGEAKAAAKDAAPATLTVALQRVNHLDPGDMADATSFAAVPSGDSLGRSGLSAAQQGEATADLTAALDDTGAVSVTRIALGGSGCWAPFRSEDGADSVFERVRKGRFLAPDFLPKPLVEDYRLNHSEGLVARLTDKLRSKHCYRPMPETLRPRMRPSFIDVFALGARELPSYMGLAVDKPVVQFRLSEHVVEFDCENVNGSTLQHIEQRKQIPEKLRDGTLSLPVDPEYMPSLEIKVFDRRFFGQRVLVGMTSMPIRQHKERSGDDGAKRYDDPPERYLTRTGAVVKKGDEKPPPPGRCVIVSDEDVLPPWHRKFRDSEASRAGAIQRRKEKRRDSPHASPHDEAEEEPEQPWNTQHVRVFQPSAPLDHIFGIDKVLAKRRVYRGSGVARKQAGYVRCSAWAVTATIRRVPLTAVQLREASPRLRKVAGGVWVSAAKVSEADVRPPSPTDQDGLPASSLVVAIRYRDADLIAKLASELAPKTAGELTAGLLQKVLKPDSRGDNAELFAPGIVAVAEVVQRSSDSPSTPTAGRKYLDVPEHSHFHRMGMTHSVSLRVYVLKGVNLSHKDSILEGGSCQPYLKLSVGPAGGARPTKTITGRTLGDTTNPEFNQLFEIDAELPRDGELRIEVWDEDTFSSDDLVGHCTVSLENRHFSPNYQQFLWNPYENWGYGVRPLTWPYSCHVEQCRLVNPREHGNASMGTLHFWVDMVHVKGPSKAERALMAPEAFAQIDFADVEAGMELWRKTGPALEKHRVVAVDRKTGCVELERTSGAAPYGSTVYVSELEWPTVPCVPIRPRPLKLLQSSSSPAAVKIGLPPPEDYELRVIVWKCTNVPLTEKDITGQASSDIYVKARLKGSSGEQSTDTHNRSTDGNGEFNWRMKFPLRYARSEVNRARRMIVDERTGLWGKLMHGGERSSGRPAVLQVELWEDDILLDDCISTVDIPLDSTWAGAAAFRPIDDRGEFLQHPPLGLFTRVDDGGADGEVVFGATQTDKLWFPCYSAKLPEAHRSALDEDDDECCACTRWCSMAIFCCFWNFLCCLVSIVVDNHPDKEDKKQREKEDAEKKKKKVGRQGVRRPLMVQRLGQAPPSCAPLYEKARPTFSRRIANRNQHEAAAVAEAQPGYAPEGEVRVDIDSPSTAVQQRALARRRESRVRLSDAKGMSPQTLQLTKGRAEDQMADCLAAAGVELEADGMTVGCVRPTSAVDLGKVAEGYYVAAVNGTRCTTTEDAVAAWAEVDEKEKCEFVFRPPCLHYAGEVLLSFQLVPASKAESTLAAGAGREDPNAHPLLLPPQRSTDSLSWLKGPMMNVMTWLQHSIPKYVGGLILAVLVIWLLFLLIQGTIGIWERVIAHRINDPIPGTAP